MGQWPLTVPLTAALSVLFPSSLLSLQFLIPANVSQTSSAAPGEGSGCAARLAHLCSPCACLPSCCCSWRQHRDNGQVWMPSSSASFCGKENQWECKEWEFDLLECKFRWRVSANLAGGLVCGCSPALGISEGPNCSSLQLERPFKVTFASS